MAAAKAADDKLSGTPRAPPGFTDHTFRSSKGTDLGVRVWPAEAPVDGPAPFVLWTHGGGWFGGVHFAPLPWMIPGFRRLGYHFVSHNYRLAPQVNLEDQLSDCLEAVSWCRANLGSVLGADKVDVDRYVLCGESAGGNLVTLMGAHLAASDAPPRAIVDVYGVVDFLSLPAFGPPAQRPTKICKDQYTGKVSDEVLAKLLRDRDPANVLTDAMPWDEHEHLTEEQLSSCWATEYRYTERALLQSALHQRYSLRRSEEGLRTGIMHGERFASEDELLAFAGSMSPLRILQQRQKQGTGPIRFPPTAFIHGTADIDVPVEQSYAMARLLKESGVPVIECYEEGEPHVFDKKYTGPEVPGWDTYIQPALDFVKKHTG
ncbi:hypothetical protein VTK26DRAFT_3529 [Humicola hyalothermophila]